MRISHDFERVKDEVQRMFLETLTFMQFLRLNNEVLGSVQRKVQINVEQGAERAGMGAAINAACCEEIGEDGELVQQPFRGVLCFSVSPSRRGCPVGVHSLLQD